MEEGEGSERRGRRKAGRKMKRELGSESKGTGRVTYNKWEKMREFVRRKVKGKK